MTQRSAHAAGDRDGVELAFSGGEESWDPRRVAGDRAFFLEDLLAPRSIGSMKASADTTGEGREPP
jgi:hypothetical protein